MLAWCITLFVVGITLFLDTFFNYGLTFRITASVLTIFMTAVLIVRTVVFMKLKKMEKLISRNAELEKQLEIFNKSYNKETNIQEQIFNHDN